MKTFYEICESHGWNDEKQEYDMQPLCYFQNIYHAYDYCDEMNAGTNNYIPPIENVASELTKYGSADVGYLTIIEHEFED